MTTWFTSDTHFAHANIIEYCGRPFANVDEMNETMISRWNARVKPEDTVYHLGDFAFGPVENIPKFLRQLNGQVHLIIGNHDRSEGRMARFPFAEVRSSLVLNVDEKISLRLSHKPDVEPRELHDFYLHGHVHEKYARRGNFINVGVDVRDFEPKTLEELLA